MAGEGAFGLRSPGLPGAHHAADDARGMFRAQRGRAAACRVQEPPAAADALNPDMHVGARAKDDPMRA